MINPVATDATRAALARRLDQRLATHARRWRAFGHAALFRFAARPLLALLAVGYGLLCAAFVHHVDPPAALASGLCATIAGATMALLELGQRIPLRLRWLRHLTSDAALLLLGAAAAWSAVTATASQPLLALYLGFIAATGRSWLQRALLLGAVFALLSFAAGASGLPMPERVTLLGGLAVAVAIGALMSQRLEAALAQRLRRFWLRRTDMSRRRALAEGRNRHLAAASHDLRQPLHALSFLARALRHRLRDDRAMTVTLRRLEQSIDATDQMCRDLLQLAQIDSNSISLKLVDVPLAIVFEALQSTFTSQAAKKGLTFQIYKTDITVRSDPVALLRILNNLVSNAVRYTDRGLVEIRALGQGGSAQVRVKDTGPGIAVEDQPLIFEEFRQLKSAREGTGLGLAIARRLADAMGHRIGIESTPGKGSTFAITLGMVDPPQVPPATDVAATNLPAEERLILFVENDPEVRKAVRPVMESWGYTVLDAATGVEAEERLSALMTVPAVMVVDHDLGGGERGDDVVKRIREVYGEAIPSLVVTGNLSTEEGVHRAMLHKPVDPNRLREAVERARRERMADKKNT